MAKKRYNFYLDEKAIWLLDQYKGKYGTPHSSTVNKILNEKADYIAKFMKTKPTFTAPQAEAFPVEDIVYTQE